MNFSHAPTGPTRHAKYVICKTTGRTTKTFFRPILASERTCITKGASGVTLTDGTGEIANLIIADIRADIGVIHVIDKVLLPGTRPACQ